jgi:predicted nucleic acid-binding protein
VNRDALSEAKVLLAGLDLVPLTGAVVDVAGDVGEPLLRSLDAIHLASALSVGADLTAFVAYDHRLGQAASAAGLRLLAPGAGELPTDD